MVAVAALDLYKRPQATMVDRLWPSPGLSANYELQVLRGIVVSPTKHNALTACC